MKLKIRRFCYQKLLHSCFLFFLLGCSSNSKKTCSQLKVIESSKSFYDLHKYLLIENLFSKTFNGSEDFNEKIVTETLISALKKMGCIVYVDREETEKLLRNYACDNGVLYLSMNNVLVHYDKEGSGALGGFVPIMHIKLGVSAGYSYYIAKKIQQLLSGI